MLWALTATLKWVTPLRPSIETFTIVVTSGRIPSLRGLPLYEACACSQDGARDCSLPSRPRRARTGRLSRRLGRGRVSVGEEQRDQYYLDRLVDVANDVIPRSHEEEEHDCQRRVAY